MNFDSINHSLRLALQQPVTAIYRKTIAIALLYGATVHIGNILGIGGTNWLDTPLLWRIMDLMLLVFDLVVAIGLWRGYALSVWFLFAGIGLLQILPYTLWRSYFILQPEDAEVINGLLGTEILLLSLFVLLLWLKK